MNTRHRDFWIIAIASVLAYFAFFGEATHAATPPAIITYQGKILQSGAAVTTTKAMGFLIYDASTSGNLVYTAGGTLTSTSTINVSPNQGIFSVDLGGTGTNAIPTSTFANFHSLYLEVVFEGQVLSPRKQITSLPYAINSEFLHGIATTNTSSSTYIPHADEFGNFLFTGNSRSGAVSGALIYMNPTSTITSGTIFGFAVNGSERLKIDSDGSLLASGTLKFSGLSTLNGGLIVNQTAGTFERGRFFVDTSGNVFASGTLRIGSDLTFIASSTAAASVAATTTLRFSHHAIFLSSSTDTGSSTFIFDTATAFASNTASYIFSVRTGGFPLFSISSNGDVKVNGTVTASSSAVGTPGRPGDLSEYVDIAVDDEVAAGDVVIVDSRNTDTYRRSTAAYDPRVAGAIATNPTIVVGFGKTSHTAALALVGRVPVKVSVENGAIAPGDLLTPASLAGHAMKYDPATSPATSVGIVGVALEAFNPEDGNATGQILVLIRASVIHGGSDAGENDDSYTDLTVTEQNGQLVRDDFGFRIGGALIEVSEIRGVDDRWQIDADGRLTVRVETSGGTSSLYASMAPETEIVLSGSGVLEHGFMEVILDRGASEIIDPEGAVTVHLTMTGEEPAGDVRVVAKGPQGFTVQELGGSSNATFDWMLRARWRLTVPSVPIEVPEPPPPPPPPPPPEETTTSTIEMIEEETIPTTTAEVAP